MVVDGTTYVTPSNNEVPYVGLEFNLGSSQFSSNVCNTGVADVNFDSSNPTFNFIGELFITLIQCTPESNAIFEGNYFNFYQSEINEPFNYNITTESNGDKMLEITSLSGNVAIYGSELLFTPEFNTSTISVFPNPVQDKLLIATTADSSVFKASIIDVSGKQVLYVNEIDATTTTIDVQKLTSGLYFISLENRQGQTVVKKFVKN